MRLMRDENIIYYFTEGDLQPSKVVHRHDRTVELTWHVDDCDDRYVRVTSSVESDDYVLVARSRRIVESAVLGDLREIFDWVSSHLVGLSKAKLNLRRADPSLEGEI